MSGVWIVTPLSFGAVRSWQNKCTSWRWRHLVTRAKALRQLDPSRDRIVSYPGEADRLEGRRPAARRMAARGGARAGGAAGGGRVWNVPARNGPFHQRARPERPGDAARDRKPGTQKLEGGPPGELKYLRAFLERVSQEWLTAAPAAAARIHFTGRIEHDDLPNLLPVCEAQVMPSTFPEAFGMVAVEAAACGALPLSAPALGNGRGHCRAGTCAARRTEVAPLVRGRAWSRRGNRRQTGRVAYPCRPRA